MTERTNVPRGIAMHCLKFRERKRKIAIWLYIVIGCLVLYNKISKEIKSKFCCLLEAFRAQGSSSATGQQLVGKFNQSQVFSLDWMLNYFLFPAFFFDFSFPASPWIHLVKGASSKEKLKSGFKVDNLCTVVRKQMNQEFKLLASLKVLARSQRRLK